MNTLIKYRIQLIFAGIAMTILANPFLYLIIGAFIIDIRNIFGAGIDRRSISFSTEDPFIQSMYIVSFLGTLIVLIGILAHLKSKPNS